ncbi:hypothetical protein OV320_0693 [Actinobacteria bacterium OV320]|nr:hypothetical protein OV320_0693 [Actinobacteria bacterium OV320]
MRHPERKAHTVTDRNRLLKEVEKALRMGAKAK